MIFSTKNFLVVKLHFREKQWVFALFKRVRRSRYFSVNGYGDWLTDNNGEHINRTRAVPFSDMFPFITHKCTEKDASTVLREQNCQLYSKVLGK